MKKIIKLLVIVVVLLGSSIIELRAQKPEYNRKGIEVASTDSLKFKIGLHTLGRAQYLTQNNVSVWNGNDWQTPSDVLDGMQTSFANIEFMLTLGDGDIDIFFDGLLATQRHPSLWWGNQGYMYIRSIPGNSFLTVLNPVLKHIDIKAGNFFANYGEHQFTRTINGDGHRNPLVGNPVVSPIGAEPGMELYHNGKGYGLMAGAGIGAPEQDFQDARGYSYRAKAWFDKIENLYLSGSYYNVNHEAGVNRGTNLFRRERHGSSYGGVWNLNNDNSGNGEGPGQARPGNGRELSAWEINAIVTPFEGNQISAYYGQAQDLGPNPNHFGQSGNEKWSYYSAEIKQTFKDNFFLASRFSVIDYSEFITADNTGSVSRFQFGFGSFITKNILFKTEYVYQFASGFNAETTGVVTSVDVGRDPSFNGVVLEVAVSF